MNITLLKALIALLPTCILFSSLVVLFLKGRTTSSFLQLVGAACLVMVVLTHVYEALHIFHSMHWVAERSVDDYLDFWSAILAIILCTIGYFISALTKGQSKMGSR